MRGRGCSQQALLDELARTRGNGYVRQRKKERGRGNKYGVRSYVQLKLNGTGHHVLGPTYNF
jgi:hypothetical protein